MFYRRPRTRLSRHPDFVLATSLKHRYRSDIHRFLSIFFFYQPIFILFFHSTSLSNPVLVSTGLASFFSSKIHDTTYLIDDRFHRRSTSKLHCSTRQQIDSETRRRAVVIVTREQSISIFFFKLSDYYFDTVHSIETKSRSDESLSSGPFLPPSVLSFPISIYFFSFFFFLSSPPLLSH